MQAFTRGTRGFARIDGAILIVILAILCVVAVPRYNRFVKMAQAKSTLQQLADASRATLQECAHKRDGTGGAEALPPDDELIRTLKKHLGGSIPENPFTRNDQISLQHHRAMGPCDALEAQGGWVWNLVPSPRDGRPAESRFWPNSDTVHIAQGRGESCIQP